MAIQENSEQPATTFCQAFKRECIKKPFEFFTLLTAIFGVGFALISIRGVEKQLAIVTKALESQAYGYIVTNQHELDKVMIEYSTLRPYFDEHKSPNNMSMDDRNKLKTLVDLKLDIIDGFYSQYENINWSRYSLPAWDKYYKDSFARSPALCQQICDDWEQYGSHIQTIAADDAACSTTIKPLSADEIKRLKKLKDTTTKRCNYQARQEPAK